MDMKLSCPVCGGAFGAEPFGLRCERGHCFDRARQGYYNLLLSSKEHGARRGDDGLMIRSRTAFLERGYYAPVREAMCDMLSGLLSGGAILDAGCGEGYYAERLSARLKEAGVDHLIIGVDISRDAVKAAARRGCYAELAVASTARLPISDGSLEAVLNIFSPPEIGEYRRVLSAGGILLRALPLEEHLYSLKAAVYEQPYRNPAPKMELEGFRLTEQRDVCRTVTVTPAEDIISLFAMTPYWYKTSPADRAKLDGLTQLDTEFAIRLAAYRKL